MASAGPSSSAIPALRISIRMQSSAPSSLWFPKRLPAALFLALFPRETCCRVAAASSDVTARGRGAEISAQLPGRRSL